MPSTDEAVRRAARALTRFMSQEEANGYAAASTLDPFAFVAAWQRQAATPLATSYVPPALEPLPPEAAAHVASLRAVPLFAATYGPQSEIKMVELGKLIACQMWVDTDVSGTILAAGMHSAPTFDELLNTCLPLSVIPPAQYRVYPVPNGLVAYSMNNSFYAQGPGLNLATGQITLALTGGANLMLVREHAGRYVLANGYHRAWLLRTRGVERVPAVVVPVATPEAVLLGEGFFKAGVLFGPRPPVINDFLDDGLSTTVEVRSMLKAVKVTVETLLIPRLL